jgi:uncharacterized membrane protein
LAGVAFLKTNYTIYELIALFYIFSFVGWVMESIYVSILSNKPVNRGFMRGPMLPIYGCGGILLILATTQSTGSNWIKVFIFGMVGSTLIEYLTGYFMEKLFKVRYWDYSERPFNFHGYICLTSSIIWGILFVLINWMLKFIPNFNFVVFIPEKTLIYIDYVLIVVSLTDFIISFKNALDIRRFLYSMQQTKNTLMEIYHKLKSVELKTLVKDKNLKISEADDDGIENNIDLKDMLKIVENKISKLQNSMTESIGSYDHEQKELLKAEIDQLSVKMNDTKNMIVNKSKAITNSYKKSVFYGNPNMTSLKFPSSFKELKEYILSFKK